MRIRFQIKAEEVLFRHFGVSFWDISFLIFAFSSSSSSLLTSVQTPKEAPASQRERKREVEEGEGLRNPRIVVDSHGKSLSFSESKQVLRVFSTEESL